MKNKIIGNRIRAIRLSLGITMQEFAKKIDSTAGSGTVNNWETGRNRPNARRLVKIAEIGETSLGYLMGEDLKICPQCKYDALEEDYKYCPICGLKVEV